MGTARDPEALLQAARLYYVEHLSQHQVAARLGTSRSNVSRMLGEAEARGIVEIRINDPTRRDRGLERELEQTFGLREARVVQHSGPFGSPSTTAEQLGLLASQLLLANLDGPTTVALSWGRALSATVMATRADRAQPVQVVPLCGAVPSVPDETNAPELVRELAARLGGTHRYLPAPATLTTSEAAQALRRERSVAEALAAAVAADLAFVGVGAPTDGSAPDILSSLGLTKKQTSEFWQQQPAGVIAGRWFDASGRSLSGPVHDRVLAVTLDDLVAIPTVVAVASGRSKVPGVLGALAGRLVDGLVCDETLARGVLAAGLA